MSKIDFSNVKKVGIDIDEVVLKSAWSFLDFYNRKHETNFLFEDIKTYDLDKAVGISPEEARKELDEFFSSEDFKKISLMDSAKEAIGSLAENFEIVFITSRPLKYKEDTKDHLIFHFGNFDFEIVHSTGSEDIDSLQDLVDKGSKGGACKDYGVDLMIEDNIGHAEDCLDKGVKVVLFDKPWNREKEEKDNLIRVNGWEDVLNELNDLGVDVKPE